MITIQPNKASVCCMSYFIFVIISVECLLEFRYSAPRIGS